MYAPVRGVLELVAEVEMVVKVALVVLVQVL